MPQHQPTASGIPLCYKKVIDVLRSLAQSETDVRGGFKSLEVLIATYISMRDGKAVPLSLILGIDATTCFYACVREPTHCFSAVKIDHAINNSIEGIHMDIKNQRIFITGGAGFIGSALAEQLYKDNEVVIYDNMARNSLAQKSFSKHTNITVIKGDVLDAPAVEKAMRGCTAIIHCAGVAGVDTVILRPVQTMLVNMNGSANILAAAAKLPHCSRVICFSTSEVFGAHAFNSTESDASIIGAVGQARWTYAVSKLAEEHLAIAYFKELGLKTVVIRPFNIYGPGQVGEGALKIFIELALQNKTIQIHGSGTQIRSWCYVDDIVRSVDCVLTNERAVGESFNIGNGRSIETIYGLANTVIRVLESKSKIEFVPALVADIELRIPNVNKAEELLGFTAQIDLENGIRKTAEYMQSHK